MCVCLREREREREGNVCTTEDMCLKEREAVNVIGSVRVGNVFEREREREMDRYTVTT